MTYRFGRGRASPALLRRPSGVAVGGAPPPGPDEIFGAGLAGWWRGDSVTTTGSLVDQMDDLSGNGLHMVQTGSNRPSAATLGGQDAVAFGGTHWLQTSSAQSLGAAPWALWAVFVIDSTTANGVVIAVTTNREMRQTGSDKALFVDGLGGLPTSTTSITSAAAVLGEDDGTNATIYVNNSSEDTVVNTIATGTAAWALGARAGGSLAATLTIADAAAISGTITTDQRAALQAYAAARYGL